MDFLAEVVSWLAEGHRWRGPSGIPVRMVEHVHISAFALLCAAAVAVPSGVWLGHVRRGRLLSVAVFNIGRALPSFAVVALVLPVSIRLGLGLGFWPTFVALFLLALPPMFTNSLTGVGDVPRDLVESARGMGMRELQVLRSVELPLAAPVIVASVRVAAVHVVATTTLGAFVGFGGLGRFILHGFAIRDFAEAFVGAVLVALLAMATELGLGRLEKTVLPAGLERVAGRREAGAVRRLPRPV